MTSPLERAARALYLRKPQTLDIFTADMADPNKMRGFIKGDLTWEDLDEDERGAYIEAARAVLEAIREPSEAMSWAGWRAEGAIFSGNAEPMVAPTACFGAMIDAALKEG